MSIKSIFVLIFEGRAGSSETIARLNQHPSIQAFPEILAPLCRGEAESEWEAVDDIFRRLVDGRPIESFTESYSKLGPAADGFTHTRIQDSVECSEDRWWYDRVGKVKNFYAVEPTRFLKLAASYNANLIHLHRRDTLRQAISWLRAAELDSRQQKWNVLQSEEPLGPIPLDPALVASTIDWVTTGQLRNLAAYEAYPGRKLSVSFEKLMGEDGIFHQLIEFLGATQTPLRPHYRRATSDNLHDAVENYGEVMDYLHESGRLISEADQKETVVPLSHPTDKPADKV